MTCERGVDDICERGVDDICERVVDDICERVVDAGDLESGVANTGACT